jgi:hypothetical protein
MDALLPIARRRPGCSASTPSSVSDFDKRHATLPPRLPPV